MIAKIVKGKGFRGLVEYLYQSHDGKQRGQLLATNLAGSTPREWTRQFGLIRRLRPTLGKAVFHASLSPSPDDQPLTDKQLAALARRFLDEMGFTDETPYIVMKHDDSAHPHIHIAASRVKPDGEVVSDAKDYQRAEAIVRDIEAEHGLKTVVPSSVRKTIKRRRRKGRNMTEQSEEEWGQISVDVADGWTDEQRREAKRQLLEEDYAELLRQCLGDEIAFIKLIRNRTGLYVSFKDGGGLYDNGDYIRVVGCSPASAACRLVATAIAKNWTAVSFSGSREFVMEAMRIAMQNGLRVVPKDSGQAAMLDEVMSERSGVGGGVAPLPAPTPNILPRIDTSKLAANKPSRQGGRQGSRNRRR
jgi:hypothetical protein